MLAAIILAAGDSIRMGRPKALLPDPEGQPFVARIACTFAAAGIRDVIVVTGSQHVAIVDAITACCQSVAPVFVTNPKPSLGQLASLQMGLGVAEGLDVDGVLVTPVDIPMVRPSTILELIMMWDRTRAPIVRPVIGERHGHPVLFDRAVFDALRTAPLNLGARTVVHAWGDRLVNVAVDDEGCLVDIDTPDDYERIVGKILENS